MFIKIGSAVQNPYTASINKNTSFKSNDSRFQTVNPFSKREEIEEKYNEKRAILASRADWTGMPSDIYFEEMKKIDEAEQTELAQFESSVRRY